MRIAVIGPSRMPIAPPFGGGLEVFVQRMVERGYTEKQVRLLSEWYLRVRKSQ